MKLINLNRKTRKYYQLIVLDSAVADYEYLLKGVVPQAEVIVLDAAEDGVHRITTTLREHPYVSAVHLVSHGAPGCLYLGNTQLSLTTLDYYAKDLQTWFGASLLLYGCNVAAGDAGAEFLSKLHQITGASIAASTKPTGSAAKGGDWELEVAIGEIKAHCAFTEEVRQSYTGVLANFTVTTSSDENDGSADGTGLALREAIVAANNNSEFDTISFDTSLSGQTITLSNGELQITDSVKIDGLGADQLGVSGNNATRVFNVDDNTDNLLEVEIEGLTITEGFITGFRGGGDGGGIYNLENLTVSDSIISANVAVDRGGGIFNDGTIAVNNSTISNNSTLNGFSQLGGGINNDGTAIINSSTISGNSAGREGGGIKNGNNIYTDAVLVVSNSTISGNSTGGEGGGIYNNGTATVNNSTISGNEAQLGGGIYNNRYERLSFDGIITVTSSIISGNVNNDDISGSSAFTSGGNNLIGNGDSAAGFTNGTNNDQVGTAANLIDAKLGPLQDNGGLTETQALLFGSPGIGGGSNPDNLLFDQRGEGFPRIADSNGDGNASIDIGAFELF